MEGTSSLSTSFPHRLILTQTGRWQASMYLAISCHAIRYSLNFSWPTLKIAQGGRLAL
ncbi:hypothetical protein [Infirmifilum uzonense]|uniref:hypothetical protein n=1 Tax=Infirmifilum uzonense TaxID=1550241 RepID=UPI00168D8D73|nr:hypothetical protein [Infirmifilum uzonense]